MYIKITLYLLNLISKVAKGDITGFIVGGEFSNIKDYPYSVYVSIDCGGKRMSCGASILNQAILLTAAHCLATCGKDFDIIAYTASELKYWGHESKVISFKVHEKYERRQGYDIALMRLERDLTLGKKMKRITILRNPPKYKTAVVAGWGRIEVSGTKSDLLKHAIQNVISRDACASIVKNPPPGTFCGQDQENHPSKGDSGSALIIDGSIQIGLVSYGKPGYYGTTVFTDVSYFYDWILKNAAELFCEKYNGDAEEKGNVE